MKCLLWYSVPFIGRYSRIWNRFSEKLLHYDEELHCGTLDPRYPEVREYLVSVFEKGMKEWNLDGFKHVSSTPSALIRIPPLIPTPWIIPKSRTLSML